MQMKPTIIHRMTLIAIGIERKSHPMIEEIFQTQSTFYYKAYLDSEFVRDPTKTIFSIEVEDKINKLAGIMNVCLQKNNYLLIEKIIRTIFPPLVNFVRKSGKVVKFDTFQKKYIDFDKTEEELFTYGACLMFLGWLYRKSHCSGSGLIWNMKAKWHCYTNMATVAHGDTNQKAKLLPPQSYDDLFIQWGYELFNSHLIEELRTQPLTLDTLFSKEIEYETRRSLGIEEYWSCAGLSTIRVEEYKPVRSKRFTEEGVTRYIGCLTRYLSQLGLDTCDITHIPISPDTLDLIFKDFGRTVHDNYAPKTEYPLYVASGLFIYALAYRYQRCKEEFLNKASETRYFELQALEQSLTEKQEELKGLESSYIHETTQLKTELDTVKKRLKIIEVENAQLTQKTIKVETKCDTLEAQLSETEALLQSLQAQLAQTQQALASQQTLPLTQKIEWLNQYGIGIGGGHANLHQLSHRLTQVTYYDALNEDLSSIQSLDVVFICTDFISHSFANKLKAASYKVGVPTYYISGTNLDLFIDVMYQHMQSQSFLL